MALVSGRRETFMNSFYKRRPYKGSCRPARQGVMYVKHTDCIRLISGKHVSNKTLQRPATAGRLIHGRNTSRGAVVLLRARGNGSFDAGSLTHTQTFV